MGVLRDSEINFVIKTTTAGEDAYVKTAAQMDAIRDKAVLTAAEMDTLAGTQKALSHEIGGASNSIESQRSALQKMTQDYRDAKLVSAALGSAIGVSGTEFEKLATEAINAGESLDGGGGGGGFAGSAKKAGDAAGGASASIGGLTFDLQLLLEIIGAVVVATGPLVAVFLAWLTVTVAIGVAMAGMFATFAIGTAGIVALGAAVGLLAENYFNNATNAAQNLAKAQTALTTATTAHQTALRQLSTAEAAVTAGRQPTVSQLNSIANAQDRVKLTATQLATAHNNLTKAQLDNARAAQGLVDPLGAIKDHAQSAALVLGAQAYPMFVQMAQAADALIQPLQDAGSALIEWFGTRLPDVLHMASDVAGIFGESFKKLDPVFKEIIDYVILRWPSFKVFFEYMADQGVNAIKGLFDNLQKLSNWFFDNWGRMTHIAGTGFDALGGAITNIAATWANWAQWITDHWPEISGTARKYVEIIGEAFSVFGQGVQLALPIIQGAWEQVKPILSELGDQFKNLQDHSDGLRYILIAVGIAFGIVIAALILFGAFILGTILLIMQLVGWISQLVGWIVDHWAPAVKWFTDVNKQANELIPNLWNAMVAGVIGAISQFMSWMGQLAALVIVKLTEMDQNVLNFLVRILTTIGTFIQNAWNAWTAFWNAVFTHLVNVWTRIYDTVLLYANAIWQAILSFLSNIRDGWINVWNSLAGFLGGALANAHGVAVNWMASIAQSMINWASYARDTVGSIFGAIAGAIGGAMSAIGGTIHNALETGRTIVDNFIHVANKTLSINIGDLPEFATGGVLPGFAPGHDTVLAKLSPGEGVLTPQAVRMIGADTVHAINHTAKGFADGGIVGALLGGASSAAGSALGGLGGFAGSIAQGAGHLVLSALMNWIGDHIGSFLSNVGGGGGGGGGVAAGGPQVMAWILAAIAATGVPASWAAPLSVLIMRESGGNPRAINLSDSNAAMGDPSRGLMQCVPLNTEILTKRGWLRHDEVRVGDETLGFNPDTGNNEWTLISEVVHHQDAEVWRIGTKHWKVDVTPNHRWWSDTLVDSRPQFETCPECGWVPQGRKRPSRGVQVHRKKVHGLANPVGRRDTLKGEFVRTHSFKGGHRLRLSAPATTDQSLDMTLNEVRILAWLMGDGYMSRPDENYSAVIYQSKPWNVVKIRSLLKDVPHTELVRDRGGNTRWTEHSFRLRARWARSMIERSGLAETGPEAMVLAMSPAQRAIWLDSMIDAEGHVQSGKKPGYSEFIRIAQVNGPVQDAIRLAVYLEGWRPTFSPNKAEERGFKPAGTVGMAKPHVAPSTFQPHEVLPVQDVWCVQTDLKTWTARQGNNIFTTGNTIGSTFAAYRLGSLPNDIYDPVANIAAGIQYIKARYGDISNVQQANASLPPKGYDNGGRLHPGTTLAVNRTGKDEFVMTQEQLAGGQHLHFHTLGKPDEDFVRKASQALDWQRRTGRIP